MGEETGERSSGTPPDVFCCYFHSFGAILTVGTEESIKNHPEPTGQIPKSPKPFLAWERKARESAE